MILSLVAALAENRVIGDKNRIPWHITDDLLHFKHITLHHTVIMGRKTFESLPQPLPNRRKLVLTRHPRRLIRNHPEIFGRYKEWRGGRHLKRPFQFYFAKMDRDRSGDIWIFSSLEMIDPEEFPVEIFICGGAQIYEQALPRCSDLFLTLVKREYEGDAFFPRFEDRFALQETIRDTPEFSILHYRNKGLVSGG